MVNTYLYHDQLSSLISTVLQPEQLREVIDMSLGEEPVNLDQLLVDCKDSLKYQVKTGRRRVSPLTVKLFLYHPVVFAFCR